MRVIRLSWAVAKATRALGVVRKEISLRPLGLIKTVSYLFLGFRHQARRPLGPPHPLRPLHSLRPDPLHLSM